MIDDEYGAYFMPRRGASRKTKRRRKSHRGAGVLITVLLILSAAICLLVVFLPRLTSTAVSSSHAFGGKTYYFLATGKANTRQDALTAAAYARERGGAGYIYNDGEYKVIASVYERESDAKTLVSVNPDSFYFALSVPSVDCDEADRSALEYLTGEWFAAIDTASAELDRGNITEAAAERAVRSACEKLNALSAAVKNNRLERALTEISSCDFTIPVLSCLRYIQVSAVISAVAAIV